MKKIFTIYFLLLATSFSFSQTKITGNLPGSPTAAALGKYGESPVGYHTGTPNISVPIVELKEGSLVVPVSMSYNLQSIKPNEVPGWTGLGWSLNAGGVITRHVSQLPDEWNHNQQGYFYDKADLNTYCNELAAETTPLGSVANAFLLKYDINERDSQPDMFSFNFNGFSGKFFMDLQGNFQTIPYSKIKIEHFIEQGMEPALSGLENSNGIYVNYISKWIITTTDGIKYCFEQREWQSTATTRIADEPAGNGPRFNVSSWYLTKIINSVGNEINFEYTQLSTSIYSELYSYYQSTGFINLPDGFGLISQYPLGNQAGSPKVVGRNYLVYLKGISTTNLKLQFETSNRSDLPNNFGTGNFATIEKKLDLIKLVKNPSQSEVIRRFALTYLENSSTRLTLLKIQEKPPIDNTEIIPPYEFVYNAVDRLPPTYASNAIDHWGYFNGRVSNLGIIPEVDVSDTDFANFIGILGNKTLGSNDRSSYEEPMKIGTLSKIIYPTGGYTEYTYEANNFSFYGSQNIAGTIKGKEAQYFQYRGRFNDNDGLIGGQIDDNDFTDEEFVITVPTEITIRRYCQIFDVPNDLSYKCYCPTQIAPPCPNFVNNEAVVKQTLQPGTYHTKDFIQIPIREQSPLTVTDVSIKIEYRIIRDVTKRTCGGLRVKSIKTNDGINTNNDIIKTFFYDKGDIATISSGSVGLWPKYYVGFFGAGRTQIIGLLGQSNSFSPLQFSNGSHITYGEVTEKRSDGASTKYKYTSFFDVQDTSEGFYPYEGGTGPRTSTDYKRGLPTEITMFNGTKKIKQTLFDYEEKVDNSYKAKGYAQETCFKRTLSTPEFCEQDRGDYGFAPCISITEIFIYSSIFETRSAWYLKNKETERVFDISDDTKFVETSTIFRYENPSHAQLTSTEMKRSDGTTLVTQLKYPLDYTVTSGTLFQMRQNATFIHSAVIEKIQTVFPVSGSLLAPKTINGIYSTFNNSFLPETISVLEISQPTTTLYPKAPALPSASDYVKKQTVNYDGYGNILEIIPVSGFPTAYLYSYGNRLLIAEVKNMTYSGLTTLMNNAPQIVINDANESTLRTTLATLRSRLPVNTLMTSFTHNTAYGITSKIEPNGITSYFGYDTLGRLSFIKDNNQKIVKSYQYNFKSQ